MNHLIDFPIDYAVDVYELFYRACHFLDQSRVCSTDFDDGTDTEERPSLGGLAVQLMRTFDLGPIDFLFGDHRSCLSVIAPPRTAQTTSPERLPVDLGSPRLREDETSRKKHEYHGQPLHPPAPANTSSIRELPRDTYYEADSEVDLEDIEYGPHPYGPVTGTCSRCYRPLSIQWDHTGIHLLQCHVNNSVTCEADQRDNHLLLYTASHKGKGYERSKSSAATKDLGKNTVGSTAAQRTDQQVSVLVKTFHARTVHAQK